jgi:hypothetical protein
MDEHQPRRHRYKYRTARSYGDVYYVVAGVLWETVVDDGVVWVLVLVPVHSL